MKLHKRYYSLVFAFFMSLNMSFLMSGVITLINLGMVDDFLHRWLLKAFPTAWAAAFPISLFVVPILRRFVSGFVEHG